MAIRKKAPAPYRIVANEMRSWSLWKYRLKFLFKLWGYELLDQWVMASIPYRPSSAILVFRLDLIGDYVLTRPFFPLLNQWAKAQSKSLVFAGNQQVRALAEAYDGSFVDRFFWIDRGRFINSVVYRYQVLAWVRKQGFSDVLYPSHTRQYWLESVVKVSGCRNAYTGESVGTYMSEWEKQATRASYRAHVKTGLEPLFEFYRNQNYFSHFLPKATEVSIRDGHFQKKRVPRSGQPLRVILAPGASTSDRKWPVENFVQLVELLGKRCPIEVILMGSPADEKEARQIQEGVLSVPVENCCGKWSLAESMEQLTEADLLVSNESAPVHMAATTGTPCVCISQGNHFGRWNPYPKDLAPAIQTVYPPEFGDVEIRFMELAQWLGPGSRVPVNRILVHAVLDVCVKILNLDHR